MKRYFYDSDTGIFQISIEETKMAVYPDMPYIVREKTWPWSNYKIDTTTNKTRWKAYRTKDL